MFLKEIPKPAYGSNLSSYITVALVNDFSGDARLARNVKNKVFSFDLVSNDPSVIACDMSNVCASLPYF